MRRDYIINEDTRPPRLPIWFVPELRNTISDIYAVNIKTNRNNTIQWFQDIQCVKSQIPERAIGFLYPRGQRGNYRMPQNILGFNVSYSVKKNNDRAYVCVYNMDLNLENYGLVNPSKVQENKSRHIILRESQLRSIIRETLRRVLLTA